MKSTSSSLASIGLAALYSAQTVLAGEQTLQGCYQSLTGFTLNSTGDFNSRGYCGTQRCLPLGYTTFGMGNSSMCYCGNTLPPTNMKVSASLCNITCPGYPSEICGGGTDLLSVYLTGLTAAANSADDSTADKALLSSVSAASASAALASSTSASASSTATTVAGPTVFVTAAAGSTPTSTPTAVASATSKPSSGPSTAGIAAGVVCGLAAAAAIAGGIYFFIRNRRRRQVEEEYRRNAAVSSFISGRDGKHPPTSSGGASSFQDLRLDPAVMAQRRMSDGSIADNQDYSRRILKVTNA